MKLSANIKSFREFRGITQLQLAETLGKSKNTISNWERGDNFPDPDTIERMCTIFEVTPNQIFGWEENPELEAYLKTKQEREKRLEELRNQQTELRKEMLKLEREIAKEKERP